MEKKFIRWLKEIGLFKTWEKDFTKLKEAKMGMMSIRKNIPIIVFLKKCKPCFYIDFSFIWEHTECSNTFWCGLNRVWLEFCDTGDFDELLKRSKKVIEERL